MLDMKLKLGFWICEEKNESEGWIAAPFPAEPMFDITWQSPYIFQLKIKIQLWKTQDKTKLRLKQNRCNFKEKSLASKTKQPAKEHEERKADRRKPQKKSHKSRNKVVNKEKNISASNK